MSLPEALKALADELAALTDTPAALLAEVSDAYDLNPALLERKFREQHACGVADYAERETARLRHVSERNALAARAAHGYAQLSARERIRVTCHWNGALDHLLPLGDMPIHYLGKTYYWAGIGDRHFVCIDAANGNPYNFRKAVWNAACHANPEFSSAMVDAVRQLSRPFNL